MRIAFISDCYWPRVNGVSVSIQTFRDQLEKMGHTTIILAPDYPGAQPDPPSPPAPAARRFPSNSAKFSREDRLVGPETFPAIFRTLDQFNPDIVHFQTEFSMFVGAQMWCKSRKKPVLITCHTNWEFYFHHYAPFVPRFFTRGSARKIMRRACLKADYILIPGTKMEELLSTYGINGPFHILPTGINPKTFSPDPERVTDFRRSWDEDFPPLRGKRILLYVGRIGEEKNVSFLLPILRRVAAEVPEVVLVMVGDGPMRKKLLSAAAKQGLQDHIYTPGYMDREQLSLAYAAASVFVFPSQTETQGLTTIEAMMTGTPVVAIGEMGTRDVMQGDNGGYMVHHDEQAFSEAVLRLLGDPELRSSKAKEARSWAMRYSVEATTEQLVQHYTDCLAGKGRRR